MPWKNVTAMDEIIRFVSLAQMGRFTVTELCEQFGISRKTGYKHLGRYASDGLKGLQARYAADFHTARTRPPSVYRGNPSQVEVGLAYGGSLPADERADL